MFIDEIKVFASAGHGGRGCIAFCREAYRPKGGPDGGNGGRGGSVILQADHDLNNLIGQFYVSRLIAEKGHHGLGKGMDGPAGKDLIVKVPCGTLVWKLPDSLEAAVSEEDEESPTAPIELRRKFTPQDEPMVIPTAVPGTIQKVCATLSRWPAWAGRIPSTGLRIGMRCKTLSTPFAAS